VRLYLVQHGQAKSEEEDPDRSLTDQGAVDVQRVARHAVEVWGMHADRVVHSGKRRARQTAEVWAELLEVAAEQADSLAPNDDPSTWVERVRSETEDLLLIGHLPHLRRLAGMLVTGSDDAPIVAFRPGGLVGLDRADTGWSIWLVLPPETI
jgi:phosphohistidine phosphatase